MKFKNLGILILTFLVRRIRLLVSLVISFFLICIICLLFKYENRMHPDMLVAEKITNIERIFMEQPNKFIAFVKREGTDEVIIWPFPYCKTRIFSDVPTEERCYAICYSHTQNYQNKYLDIHIHNIKEIEGSSWNHDKFGKGRMNSIE